MKTLLNTFEKNFQSIKWIQTNFKQQNALIQAKLISPITYRSVTNTFTKEWLTNITTRIKKHYKKMTSMPQSTPTAALHLKIGGMGLQNLEAQDDRIFLKHIYESLNSDFELIKYSTRDRYLNEIKKLRGKTPIRPSRTDIRRFIVLLNKYQLEISFADKDQQAVITWLGTPIQPDHLANFLKKREQISYKEKLKQTTWWWSIKHIDWMLSSNISKNLPDKYTRFLIKARTQILPLRTILQSWNTEKTSYTTKKWNSTTNSYEDNIDCPICNIKYDTLKHLPECREIPSQQIWKKHLEDNNINPDIWKLKMVFDEQIPTKLNTPSKTHIGYYGAIHRRIGGSETALPKKDRKKILQDFYCKYLEKLYNNFVYRYKNT
jgi:hypothetical protein